MVLFRAVFSADVEKSEKRGNIAILPQCLLEASSDLQHRDRMGKDSIPVFDGFQSYFMHLLVYIFEDSHFFLTFASLGQWWAHGLSSIVSEFAPTYASPMLLVSCALSVMYPLQSTPKSPFFSPQDILFSNWRDLSWFLFQTSDHYTLSIADPSPALLPPLQEGNSVLRMQTNQWCAQWHKSLFSFALLFFLNTFQHQFPSSLCWCFLPAIEPQISSHPLHLQELVPENQ